MRIIHYDAINATEAIPFYAAGWADLLAQGLADNSILVTWDDEVLVAKEVNRVVGVLIFVYDPVRRIIFVKFGYVAPKFRRQRVYSKMFADLIEIAKSRRASEIESATGVLNRPMQETYAALGRKAKAIIYTYPVLG